MSDVSWFSFRTLIILCVTKMMQIVSMKSGRRQWFSVVRLEKKNRNLFRFHVSFIDNFSVICNHLKLWRILCFSCFEFFIFELVRREKKSSVILEIITTQSFVVFIYDNISIKCWWRRVYWRNKKRKKCRPDIKAFVRR